MPPVNTEAVGIFQADVIIRSALILALADMRKNAFLLDYVFQSLRQDQKTVTEYGDKEIARAKEWFLSTNIPVVFNVTVNDAKFPCISVVLSSSQEQEQEGTLSDTHYIAFEDNAFQWPTLAGPFSPIAYVAATGTFTVAPASIGNLVVVPGMVVVSASGKEYPILGVDGDSNQLSIAPGTVDKFSGMLIKSANPAYVTELESFVCKESFAIGCHVSSEPVHLTYLHSIVVFAIKRYTQELLEARGFERSVINSLDFRRDEATAPEFVYSRYIQMTGSVRQVWPKTITSKVTSIGVAVKASTGTGQTATVADDPLDAFGEFNTFG